MWVDDEGFSAELHAVFSGETIDPVGDVSPVLPITVNQGKRYLLVNPFIGSLRSENWGKNRLHTTTIELRAHEMVIDFPWEGTADLLIESIEITSSGLRLWYGDETAKLRYDYKKYTFSAGFSALERKYLTKHGNLAIGLSITLPKQPHLGTYEFLTKPYARLELNDPISMTEVSKTARAIFGYFELLASFPSQELNVRVRINRVDEEKELKLTVRRSELRRSFHPQSVFISRSDYPGFIHSFEAYIDKYSEIRIMQSVLYYLSGENMAFPEGFLTACNVIETIGESAPVSNKALAKHLSQIGGYLNRDNKKLGRIFNEHIRTRLNTSASFKDRFLYGSKLLRDCGVEVTLKPNVVSGARGVYRHNIIALKDGDLTTMQAAVGLASFLGTVWLCKEVGISRKVRSKAAQREIYHRMRGTWLSLWGQIERPPTH